MAGEADRGFIRGFLAGMNGMAGNAGDIVSVVGADVPVTQHGGGGMTAETLFVQLSGRASTAFAEGNNGFLGRIVHVLVRLSVAVLAGIFLVQSFPGPAVIGLIKRWGNGFVTVGADTVHHFCRTGFADREGADRAASRKKEHKGRQRQG